jgi:hypothetical protein
MPISSSRSFHEIGLQKRLIGVSHGISLAAMRVQHTTWFLPPHGSLSITGLDNHLALALFVLGTVVGIIVVDGNQWVKRWITTSDPDR